MACRLYVDGHSTIRDGYRLAFGEQRRELDRPFKGRMTNGERRKRGGLWQGDDTRAQSDGSELAVADDDRSRYDCRSARRSNRHSLRDLPISICPRSGFQTHMQEDIVDQTRREDDPVLHRGLPAVVASPQIYLAHGADDRQTRG